MRRCVRNLEKKVCDTFEYLSMRRASEKVVGGNIILLKQALRRFKVLKPGSPHVKTVSIVIYFSIFHILSDIIFPREEEISLLVYDDMFS